MVCLLFIKKGDEGLVSCSNKRREGDEKFSAARGLPRCSSFGLETP